MWSGALRTVVEAVGAIELLKLGQHIDTAGPQFVVVEAVGAIELLKHLNCGRLRNKGTSCRGS